MKMLLLVLICFAVGCYAANGLPKHDERFEKYNEKKKPFNKQMLMTKENIHDYRTLQKTHDHPPAMSNNVTVSISKTTVIQGDTIDISFTTASGAFPSYDDAIVITYDDVEFNTTYVEDWSIPNKSPMLLGFLQSYNPITGEYEDMYNNETGVLSGYLLPYLPNKFKAVLYYRGGWEGEADSILGVSETFEIVENTMSIVAKQNKRQVSFDIEASAPIRTGDYGIAVILDKETVPDTFDYMNWKPVYNSSTSLPDELEGTMKGTFTGLDRSWPKGEYKLVMYVTDTRGYYYNMYTLGVSNTIIVQKTVCGLNKQGCRKTSDCCGDQYSKECRKFSTRGGFWVLFQ
jgi:hypothetical protein